MTGLEPLFEQAGATGFVHAVDLATGAELGLRPDEPVVAASVFKVPILVTLCRAFAAGIRQPTDRITVPATRRTIGPTGLSALTDDVTLSIRDLATLMISVSDNTATDVLLDLIGLDAVNATLSELDLPATRLIENCDDLIAGVLAEVGDPELLATADPATLAGLRALDPLRTNRTTPREATALLTRIWHDEAGSPSACAEARRILGLQIWPHRLRSGFPAAVTVSGKTGTLPGIRNEIGVVEHPDGGAYAVAVFTRAHTFADPQPAIDAAIGAAARTAVDELRGAAARKARGG